MVAELTHFAESFQSFHYGSQKVNTYFTGLPRGTIASSCKIATPMDYKCKIESKAQMTSKTSLFPLFFIQEILQEDQTEHILKEITRKFSIGCHSLNT